MGRITKIERCLMKMTISRWGKFLYPLSSGIPRPIGTPGFMADAGTNGLGTPFSCSIVFCILVVPGYNDFGVGSHAISIDQAAVFSKSC